MFKHRLSKIGKASLFAACMLLLGGSFQSCEDDYFYPDEEPSWLGASIYNFLEVGSPGHTYKYYVELIDSLGEKETLAHTGSKTLFVADDEAFERFFQENEWGVKSISEMTKAQMKILLFSSMLDNAMLLEMLSSTGSSESSDGSCLRRLTSYSVLDSIPFVKGDDLPKYNKYWDALRGTNRNLDSLRLAKDGSDPMMVHFLPEYLKTNAIQPSDIEFLFRKNGVQTNTYTSGEAMIFGNKLLASGVPTNGFSDDTMTITCKNGYIYRLDKVLIPPSNMAEELRKHKDTKVFSHLLDRFCVPVHDEALSSQYRAYHNSNDSIFRLRYFTKDFTGLAQLGSKYNPAADELLPFDPGWNQFSVGANGAQSDMAAMFVPRDEVLYEYFVSGAGEFLLEQYAKDVTVENLETLMGALDLVPEKIVIEFLYNLMKASFSNTVLSKFELITDDAHDEMGIKEEHVDECVIANNGVIYILNNVFGPASYQAVSAPTLVFDNMEIMNKVVNNLKYNYYLLAMDADYSFIVPDDSCFVYYDPVSVNAKEPKAYEFRYDAMHPKNKNSLKLWANVYKFKEGTYEITDTLTELDPANLDKENFGSTGTDNFWKNRMIDLLEYIIVVHDEGDGVMVQRPDGSLNPRKYYKTKGHGTIKIDASDPEEIKIQGGEQIENGTVITTKKIYNQKNGTTFCTVPLGDAAPNQLLSGLPTPPTKSVYTNMYTNGLEEGSAYHEFFKLCNPAQANFAALFNEAYKDEQLSETKMADTLKLYSIFYTNTSSTSGISITNLVSFFNSYHYTVYVPSNDAVMELVEAGLPVWDEIFSMAKDAPMKALSEMRLLNSFLRYHFQDNSVYVDNVPFSVFNPDGSYDYESKFATALINKKTGRFFETTVKNSDDNSTLLVVDDMGRTAKVLKDGEEGKLWNVMTRDIQFTSSNIDASSFAVIQPIDNVLLNSGLYGYDGHFCRYADGGQLVDTMSVANIDGLANVDGKKPYLVANYGEVQNFKDAKGVERIMRLAYLMKPLPENEWDKYTRETCVLDAEGNPMLITNEGFLVEAVVENKKVTYKYVLDVDGKMQQVDNNGNVKTENSEK